MNPPAQPNSAGPVGVNVSTEYGTLRRVAMRYAGDVLPTLDGPQVHPVLARQKHTSHWTPYNPEKVRAQQQTLIDLLRDRGVDVVILPPAPGCSTQHYPRDIAFVIDDVLVAARLNSAHRQPETAAINSLSATAERFAPLAAGTVEGGDVLLHDGFVLVGLSEETSAAGVDDLRQTLARHSVNRDVVPVRFAGPGIVHLDDHLNVVAPGTALIHRAVFPPDQLRWLTAHFDDLIDVTDDEAHAVQVNVLAVAPGVVIIADGSNRIAAQLTARGIEVISLDYSEVTRIPGSLRCGTLPLLRT